MVFNKMDVDKRQRADFSRQLQQDQSRLYGYIHSLVRDLNDTDDLFQQTALILWNKYETYDPERSFFGWACGIVRFEVANFLRSRGRQRLYFSDEFNLTLLEATQELVADDEAPRLDALQNCMGKLRERDRELLQQCYENNEARTTIAANAGRSPQSLANSLRRIRRALFECVSRTLAISSRGAS
jgi:RNA polymerase sigma-70 factor (ECF subfamily)